MSDHQLEGMAHVLEPENYGAAQPLLGFGVRAIGNDDFAAPRPQSLRSLNALQRDSAKPSTLLATRLVEGDAFVHHSILITLRNTAPVATGYVSKAGEFYGVGVRRRNRPRLPPFRVRCH